VIWKTRNKICFEKKFIKNPCEIICPAYAFMRYWLGLYPFNSMFAKGKEASRA
jgi:hypothetical protein